MRYLWGQPQFRSTASANGATSSAAWAKCSELLAANCTTRGLSARQEGGKEEGRRERRMEGGREGGRGGERERRTEGRREGGRRGGREERREGEF